MLVFIFNLFVCILVTYFDIHFIINLLFFDQFFGILIKVHQFQIVIFIE
jgi:hypothetical protein